MSNRESEVVMFPCRVGRIERAFISTRVCHKPMIVDLWVEVSVRCSREYGSHIFQLSE